MFLLTSLRHVFLKIIRHVRLSLGFENVVTHVWVVNMLIYTFFIKLAHLLNAISHLSSILGLKIIFCLKMSLRSPLPVCSRTPDVELSEYSLYGTQLFHNSFSVLRRFRKDSTGLLPSRINSAFGYACSITPLIISLLSENSPSLFPLEGIMEALWPFDL